MKFLKYMMATFAMVMLAPGVHAQVTLKTPVEFVKAATVGNIFEIKSSELALQKTKQGEILAFAEKMIADHSKAGKDMMAVLPNSTVAPGVAPKTLDEAHQVVYDKLTKMDGEEFDKAYVKAQVDAHKEAVMLYTNYSNNGSDKVLKNFAAKTLPTLKLHQEHVEHLHASKLNMN